MYNNVFKKCGQLKNVHLVLCKPMYSSLVVGFFFLFLFPSVAVHEREREHTSKFYLDHRCSFLTKHVNFTGARPMTLLTFLTRSPDLGQRSS